MHPFTHSCSLYSKCSVTQYAINIMNISCMYEYDAYSNIFKS